MSKQIRRFISFYCEPESILGTTRLNSVPITVNYLPMYGSTAQVDLGRFFAVSKSIHSRWDSLDGGSASRKAATYTQNNRNIE
jgi:hypothetical protein